MPDGAQDISRPSLSSLPQISMLEEPFLDVNCDHLHRFNRDLYSQLVRYPQEVIPTFDLATNELFSHVYPETALEYQIQVQVQNMTNLVSQTGWPSMQFTPNLSTF